MRYEIPFAFFGDSAKNVGIIPERARSDATWIALDAPTDAEAFAAIVKMFSKTDRRQRPVSGQSYVRHWRATDVTLVNGLAPLDKLSTYKIGDKIILHAPYACSHTDDGNGYRRGVVDECLGGHRYGIKLEGYPNIADFTVREFAQEV